ncbi:hypothetical protein [Streptomyces sp. NPDC093149]|uniref:hypothetical protein n=1 Tax=Streptomyces sp. NPDC093149 TaxID=3366031 RepID=UPI00381F58ED
MEQRVELGEGVRLDDRIGFLEQLCRALAELFVLDVGCARAVDPGQVSAGAALGGLDVLPAAGHVYLVRQDVDRLVRERGWSGTTSTMVRRSPNISALGGRGSVVVTRRENSP